MQAHKVQHIAITFEDLPVGIMQFVLDPRLPLGTQLPGLDDGKTIQRTREATDEAIQHEIDKSSFHDRKVVSWRRIKLEDVPQDRAYRGAWKDEGKAIGHDMAKAKDLHRDHLRAHRAPLLTALDAEYQQADEANDQAAKKVVAAKRQKLRDVTVDPRIEAAKTVEALMKITIA